MKNLLVVGLVIFIMGLFTGTLLNKINQELFKTKLNSVVVIDGDTIHVVNNNKVEKIRLVGIDCHETHYNSRAEFQSKIYKLYLEEIYQKGESEKVYLENLINDNQDNIYIARKGKDKYNRTLGTLYIGRKININKLLLENNICPPYVERF